MCSRLLAWSLSHRARMVLGEASSALAPRPWELLGQAEAGAWPGSAEQGTRGAEGSVRPYGVSAFPSWAHAARDSDRSLGSDCEGLCPRLGPGLTPVELNTHGSVVSSQTMWTPPPGGVLPGGPAGRTCARGTPAKPSGGVGRPPAAWQPLGTDSGGTRPGGPPHLPAEVQGGLSELQPRKAGPGGGHVSPGAEDGVWPCPGLGSASGHCTTPLSLWPGRRGYISFSPCQSQGPSAALRPPGWEPWAPPSSSARLASVRPRPPSLAVLDHLPPLPPQPLCL